MHCIAPGRVNIIGEHIDHQNYAVLPCAIDKSVEAEADYAPIHDGGAALTVVNVDPERYPTKVFRTADDIKIGEHCWTNYVVAAYLGVVEYLSLGQNAAKVGTSVNAKKGLTADQRMAAGEYSPTHFSISITISGNIPPGAGLSSSSALVVCSAYAISLCAGKERAIDKHEMALICTNAERYVGTAGGGMDQAAICLSEAGKAQLINFNPIRTRPIHLPKEVALVIANTCREAPKVRDASKMYNKRVFELKTACVAILAKKSPEEAIKLSGEEIIQLTLDEVITKYLSSTPEAVLRELSLYLEERPYTKTDIDGVLGVERRDVLLRKRCGEGVWHQNAEFFLFLRVRHVLTETLRVSQFVNICETRVNPVRETPTEVLQDLGQLLNDSESSLNEDFDCGCEEIEMLCNIARKAGAFGARLTGAGWGGCVIALIRKEDTERFLQRVEMEYYKPYMTSEMTAEPPLEHLPHNGKVSQALFVTLPGPAAHFYD